MRPIRIIKMSTRRSLRHTFFFKLNNCVRNSRRIVRTISFAEKDTLDVWANGEKLDVTVCSAHFIETTGW